MNMKYLSKFPPAVLLVIFIAMVGCNKDKPYEIKELEPEVHFVGDVNQSYSIVTNPPPVHTITVGTTDVADVDRVVGVNVSSPTGATAGTQYTISGLTGGTITIPAGKSTASFTVQGNYASYATSGRKDTLVFSLKEPSIKTSGFLNTVKLALRGPCFEGDIQLADFLGVYNNTIETFGSGAPYGPYRTTISNVTQLTPTTGTITVTNIWDNGWSPITFTLDWTNLNNRTVTVVSQPAIGGSNAGDLNSAYAGQTVQVRPFSGQPGTFSWCNGKLTLRMQLGVTAVGFFAGLYTVNMSR